MSDTRTRLAAAIKNRHRQQNPPAVAPSFDDMLLAEADAILAAAPDLERDAALGARLRELAEQSGETVFVQVNPDGAWAVLNLGSPDPREEPRP